MKIPLRLAALLLPFALIGCAGTDSPTGYRNTSPTAALLRGELSADEYADAVRNANEEARDDAQLGLSREPTRAWNTRTQRIEFVPIDASQRWNEAAQRWEFTPVE